MAMLVKNLDMLLYDRSIVRPINKGCPYQMPAQYRWQVILAVIPHLVEWQTPHVIPCRSNDLRFDRFSVPFVNQIHVNQLIPFRFTRKEKCDLTHFAIGRGHDAYLLFNLTLQCLIWSLLLQA